MAKRRQSSASSVTTAAEIVGQAAGQAAAAVDAFRSRHPHPIAEVGEAMTAGQEVLADVAAQALSGSAAVVAKTKDVAQRAQKIVRRARRRVVKTLARSKRTTKKAAANAKKASGKRSQVAAHEPAPQRSVGTVSSPARRKKRGSKRSSAIKHGSAGPNVASKRRLQTAHVKRRQAHAASRARRRQARRDKGR